MFRNSAGQFVKGSVFPESYRAKIARGRLGVHHDQETRSKISASKMGHTVSLDTRLKFSLAQKGKPKPFLYGSRNGSWKGGITPTNQRERKSLNHKNWSRAVLRRDNFRCLDCGERAGSLEVDHIYPFSLFPRLRYVLENSRTLCKYCHRKTDTYGAKANRFTVADFIQPIFLKY
jgi:hypothetical protein